MFPGAAGLILGALLCLQVGVISRNAAQTTSTSTSTTTPVTLPVFSIPLAVAIICVCLVGLIGEDRGIIWKTSSAECFRQYVDNVTALNDLKSTGLCALYPLNGEMKNNNTQHQAMYMIFICPAVVNLVYRMARCMCQIVPPGLLMLERYALLFSFAVKSVIWREHASRMEMDPCWDEHTKNMMTLNVMWHTRHTMLANISFITAVIAVFLMLRPTKWDPILAVGAAIMWQGMVMLLVGDALYGGSDGSPGGNGRWLPEPTGNFQAELCRAAAQRCDFDGGSLNAEAMNDYGIALFAITSVVSVFAGIASMLVGWIALDCYYLIRANTTFGGKHGAPVKFELVATTGSFDVHRHAASNRFSF